MKKLFIFLMICIIMSSCESQKSLTIDNKNLPSLQDVVSEVQRQYEQALKQLENEGITNVEITNADLTLKIAKASTVDAEIKVLIFKIGKERTQSKSTSVTYTLTKKENKAGSGKIKFTDTDIKDVIISAAKEFNSLEVSLGHLVKEEFEIDIVFSIYDKNAGGLSFEVWNIGVDGSANRTKSAEHQIKLTFKNK
ncbi:hypothetical protein [Cyclobacterium sp. SYSU L10401]|uniref:hypothetical protein n=1 Tax=Cyclobacterium sp. SYSU L10401 TaxID=2678657 RepID=UPI0013D4E1AA|nr:hypothetical protein [Cyclobacterium sp. SYSU L10401]